MPYLLRCINCNHAIAGEFRDTVIRQFERHHKKSHPNLRPRSTITVITDIGLKAFRIQSKQPDFWEAYNHKRLPIF